MVEAVNTALPPHLFLFVFFAGTWPHIRTRAHAVFELIVTMGSYCTPYPFNHISWTMGLNHHGWRADWAGKNTVHRFGGYIWLGGSHLIQTT